MDSKFLAICLIFNTIYQSNGQTICSSSWCREGSECILLSTSPPNWSCRCLPGYGSGVWINPDQGQSSFTCSDMDECLLGNNQCLMNATCVNTIGGYQCICPPGQKLWLDPIKNQHCLDSSVDICTSNVHLCGLGTQCNAKGNTYACRCSRGFSSQNFSIQTRRFQCYDEDECEVTPGLCGQHALCENQIGSFRCVCTDGMQHWTGPAGTGLCSGIDVCEDEFIVCSNGTRCVSELQSRVYDCNCLEGYTTSQIEAVSKTVTCSDIDECSSSSEPTCDKATSTCVNSLGTYRCECHTGFRQQGNDQKICQADLTIGVELIVGVSVTVTVTLVIFIILLVCWCKRYRRDRPDPASSTQDLVSISGPSEPPIYPMTPTAMLSVSSHSGSSKFQPSLANGIMKTSLSNGVYHVHTITERMVRSRKRQKVRSIASSYVSRKSSISHGSQPSFTPGYFETISNDLPVGEQTEEDSQSEREDDEEIKTEGNGKGKIGKGKKAKMTSVGLNISADKLPENVHVMVESHLVTPTEKLFSTDSHTSIDDNESLPEENIHEPAPKLCRPSSFRSALKSLEDDDTFLPNGTVENLNTHVNPPS